MIKFPVSLKYLISTQVQAFPYTKLFKHFHLLFYSLVKESVVRLRVQRAHVLDFDKLCIDTTKEMNEVHR